MYHAVSDNIWGIEDLFVSPRKLESQLQYLRDNGYTTVTFESFPIPADITKPIILTFDDGYRCNYEELFPLLKAYEAKATIFICSSFIGRSQYLTRAQIIEMSESGLVSFQCHTSTHPDLTSRSAASQRDEYTTNAAVIEELTGKAPIALAYPIGAHNNTVVSVASEYFTYAVTTRYGKWKEGSDLLRIPRVRMSRGTNISSVL